MSNIKINNSRELNFRNRNSIEITRVFRNLPKELPQLKIISFEDSTISNFEVLTAKMPNLKSLSFSDCYIHNFRGLPPNIYLVFLYCIIDSFEGIELPIPTNNDYYENEDEEIDINVYISLRNCTIRSLGGISRSTLQAILIAILSMDFPEEKYNDNIEFEEPEFHKQRLHRIKLDLPTTAIKLIQEAINNEIEQRYSPKYNRYWPLRWTDRYINVPEDHPMKNIRYEIPDFYIDEWQLFNNGMFSRHQQLQDFVSKDQWIYGFNLMERLFIPKNLDRLHEYYKKTTRQLAQDYITAPESLSPELIERLIHEITPELRKMLENNLPPSDPVIKQITAKFSFKTPKGLKILK